MKLTTLKTQRETAPPAHALLPWEGVDRSALSKAYGETLASELIQLQMEENSDLRSQGLWNAATREELRGNLAFASEAYTWLSEHGTEIVREKARERLGLLEGKGTFGQRAEHLLRGFAQEASNPTMLLAMCVGGTVYKATKLATMSRLVGSSGYWGRGVGMKLAGSVAGYALEAPVFTAVGRWGRGEKLFGPGLKEELLSSYLVLGAMKTVGGLSRELGRGMGRPRWEKLAGDVGLYGGIMLGHGLEAKTGLRPWHEGGQEWVDGLAMFLQLKTSGRILKHVGGGRYREMERELEYRSEHLANEGAFHRAANDGKYLPPVVQIGFVSSPFASAANDGRYRNAAPATMNQAVGGEPFQIGESIQLGEEAARPWEGAHHGLKALGMGKTDGSGSGNIPTTRAPNLDGMDGLRSIRDATEPKGMEVLSGVLGDKMQSLGLRQGELVALEAAKAALEKEGKTPGEEYFRISEALRRGYAEEEKSLRAHLGKAERYFTLEWEQGFLGYVSIKSGAKAANLDSLLNHPAALLLRSLRFDGEVAIHEFRKMVRLPRMSQIRRLNLWLGYFGDLHAVAIARSPYLLELQELDFGRNIISQRGLSAFARNKNFKSLLTLSLRSSEVDGEGMQTLSRSKVFHRLQVLDLGNNRIDGAGLQALAASRHFTTLRTLDLWHLFGSGRQMETGFTALAESEAFPNLERLVLGDNHLGDAPVRALANTPAFNNLRILDLTACGIGDEGAGALARSEALAGLQRLKMSHNPISDNLRRELASRFGDRVSF